MENKSVVLFLILMNTSLYAMEQNPQINYKKAYQEIKEDFYTVASDQLITYEKKGAINISELIEYNMSITGSIDIIKQLLLDIKYEYDNHITHIAIKYADVDLIQCLLKHGIINCIHMNTKEEYPLDICIKQLLPTVMDTGERARQIFDFLIPHIATLPEKYDPFKYRCLKKIIALQLNHKKHNNDFFVDENLLQILVPQQLRTQPTPTLFLLRKEIVDDVDGNTWSHILVEQENADTLYELGLMNQISWRKNKHGHTVFDIATRRFQEAIKSIGVVGADEESFNRRKCCFFVISNCLRNIDIKNGTPNVEPIYLCCKNKHKFQ